LQTRMSLQRAPKGFNPRIPGVQTPLQKAIRRALLRRTSGMSSLRKITRAQLLRWRAEGVPDTEVLDTLLGIASDVANATGSDRTDLVTGQPRWTYVAEEIRRIVGDGVSG
jgi:hypothetical protein